MCSGPWSALTVYCVLDKDCWAAGGPKFQKTVRDEHTSHYVAPGTPGHMRQLLLGESSIPAKLELTKGVHGESEKGWLQRGLCFWGAPGDK